MGVLGQTLPPQEQGNLGPCCRLSRRCLINRLLSSGRTIDDAGRPAEFSGARRAGMRTHNGMLSYVCAVCRLVCYRPSKRGTEDGVRDDGGWGATPGIGEEHLQAGGPRSVRFAVP
ncbi:hypothetical protein EVAR_87144_1 [Eumeta japonica]|uniref:Uncharacterized protein n=1 Tax=Eumeta variegata TaxID=151549 RepID=A0A4C1VV22_EUMVA|nr:hypothetical protein EVAR_87144_1 [Eumeta japonica]